MDNSTIREAVAVFDDAERLETAISELQSHGIDRAELSVLAEPALVDNLPGGVRQIADDPAAARDPVINDTDLRQGQVLGTGLAATIAGLVAAGITVAAGGVAGLAAAAAAVSAGGVGVAGALLGHRLADEQTSFFDAQLARGGVLLWVRTRDPDTERSAVEVLRRYSAHVHLHDLPTANPPRHLAQPR